MSEWDSFEFFMDRLMLLVVILFETSRMRSKCERLYVNVDLKHVIRGLQERVEDQYDCGADDFTAYPATDVQRELPLRS